MLYLNSDKEIINIDMVNKIYRDKSIIVASFNMECIDIETLDTPKEAKQFMKWLWENILWERFSYKDFKDRKKDKISNILD